MITTSSRESSLSGDHDIAPTTPKTLWQELETIRFPMEKLPSVQEFIRGATKDEDKKLQGRTSVMEHSGSVPFNPEYGKYAGNIPSISRASSNNWIEQLPPKLNPLAIEFLISPSSSSSTNGDKEVTQYQKAKRKHQEDKEPELTSSSRPPLKKVKKTLTFEFESHDALFFSKTAIDYDFIVKHLAHELPSEKIDESKAVQQFTVTQDDILRWCILEFLIGDIRMYDRRNIEGPLIHNTPENRFELSLKFCLRRRDTTKNITLDLTLLKPLSSKLDKDEIAINLGRILREELVNHRTNFLSKKRKWSSSRPHWGLGHEDELSIIDLKFSSE
ncbi:hypothetical protein BON22_5355 [Cyberlindnera fabianii]|nr:hypothetical protein BON22_5355 [Cyberlindnera fabianii]